MKLAEFLAQGVVLARGAAASAAACDSTSSCSPFGINSLLPSAPILGTHLGASSSSAGAWSLAGTDSSASPSPYVLPISLLSFGDILNKSFGVGMIKGVTTCSLTFRAEVRAGVTTPALVSSARASAIDRPFIR